MKSETFVTFEQARLLKACGFDWECNHYYFRNNETLRWCYPADDYSQSKEFYSAPRLSSAQKWLREVKGMDIYVIPRFQNAYEVAVKRLGKAAIDTIFVFDLWDSTKPYPTYESALSAGITAALELIKQK